MNLFEDLAIPIIQAPMVGAVECDMVVAVSKAGGLGTLGCAAMSPDEIAAAARDIGSKTFAPFGLNLLITRPTKPSAQTLDAALERMRQENTQLSEEQARHLTIHAVSRNEDGTYSWKFDPYLRSGVPTDIALADMHALWASIACPVLLCWGTESWALDPTPELKHFQNARVAAFQGAGHWVHHDKFDAFLSEIRDFLK